MMWIKGNRACLSCNWWDKRPGKKDEPMAKDKGPRVSIQELGGGGAGKKSTDQKKKSKSHPIAFGNLV